MSGRSTPSSPQDLGLGHLSLVNPSGGTRGALRFHWSAPGRASLVILPALGLGGTQVTSEGGTESRTMRMTRLLTKAMKKKIKIHPHVGKRRTTSITLTRKKLPM